MNKILTYEDLLREKQQLQVLLQAQKELVRFDANALREALNPAADTISFIGKVIQPDHHNVLLNSGANRIIDLIVKKVILARSGWLTRLIVPFFVKNYSSHLIEDKKEKLFGKLFSWIGLKKSNGHVRSEKE